MCVWMWQFCVYLATSTIVFIGVPFSPSSLPPFVLFFFPAVSAPAPPMSLLLAWCCSRPPSPPFLLLLLSSLLFLPSHSWCPGTTGMSASPSSAPNTPAFYFCSKQVFFFFFPHRWFFRALTSQNSVFVFAALRDWKMSKHHIRKKKIWILNYNKL